MNEQQKAKALEALQWLENRYQMMTNPAGAIEHTIDAVMEIRQCLAPVSDEGRKAAINAIDYIQHDWQQKDGRSVFDEQCEEIRTALSQPSMEAELAEALEHYSYMPRLMCKNRDIYKLGPSERMVYSADIAKAALARYREPKK